MELISQADLPWLAGCEAPGRVHGQGQLRRPDQHDGEQPRWCRCRWGEGGVGEGLRAKKLAWDLFKLLNFSFQVSNDSTLPLKTKFTDRLRGRKSDVWACDHEHKWHVDRDIKTLSCMNEAKRYRVDCAREEIEARQMKSIWCVSHQS